MAKATTARLDGMPDAWETDLIARLRAAIAADTMAELFAASRWGPLAGDARLVGCEVVRVFPRGARGFVVVYLLRLEEAGRESCETLYGELVPGDPEAHFRTSMRRLGGDRRESFVSSVPGGPIACIPDPGIVVRRPGYDEALLGLRLLHRPEDAIPILAAQGLPVPGPGCELTAELLGHRLGKRGVVRFSWGPPQGEGSARGAPASSSVVAKLFKHRSKRARSSYDAMRALWRDGLDGSRAIRVPRIFGHAADEAAIFLEDIPGRPLPLLGHGDMPFGMASAGRALARLHRCQIAGMKSHGVGDEVNLLEAWVDLVGRVRPELRSAIAPALSAVRGALARTDAGMRAAIHRDFHPKQIFVDAETTVLIDFDTLCQGDPALDVGNFLAHLRLTALQSGEDTGGHAAAFLSGYGVPTSGEFEARRAAYEKSALLRLACLYALSTRWGDLVRPLLRGVA